MTREEAVKILSVLKAAYPNSYRGMTKDEANGTIGVWAVQFCDIPYPVVSIAVNKLISTNTFPPSINEVKEKIQSLYWEASGMLESHRTATIGIKLNDDDPNETPVYMGKRLDDKTLALVQEIVRVTEPMKTKQLLEPSLDSLLTGLNGYLLGGNSDSLKLK